MNRISADDMKALKELEEALDEVGETLTGAVTVVEDAMRIANRIGGEVGRVVGGQLDLYLKRWLENFVESEHQPGSVASLTTFLTKWQEEAEEMAGESREGQKREVGKMRERMTGRSMEAADVLREIQALERSLVAFDDSALESKADEIAKQEKDAVSKNIPGVTLKDEGDQNARANKNWPLTEAERNKVATRLLRLANAVLDE